MLSAGASILRDRYELSVDASLVLAGINAKPAPLVAVRGGLSLGGDRRGGYYWRVPLLAGACFYRGDSPEVFERRFASVTQVSVLANTGVEFGWRGSRVGFVFRALAGVSHGVITSIEDIGADFDDNVKGFGVNWHVSLGWTTPF